MPASVSNGREVAGLRTPFRELLEASPDAIVVIDAADNVLCASARAATMLGYEPADLVGRPVGLLLPQRFESSYAERFQQFASVAFSGDLQPGDEIHAVRRDGSEFPVETSLGRYGYDGQDVVVVAIRDITERKAIEARLRQTQKMDAIGNLSGGLAHDFNNLLSIVIGNLDLLHEDLTDPGLGDMANAALTAALRAADLTNQLLAFARRQPLQPRQIDLNALVTGMNAVLGRTVGGTMTIEPILTGDVWPVAADPTQLEAAIVSLASNARAAMSGEGRLLLKTCNRHLDADYASLHADLVPGDYAMIEVTDSGTGMPPEIVARIFEPFFTTRREARAAGLGLSMVFGFIKQSGGHVSVYSEVGSGTTVRLFLPRSLRPGEVIERPTPAREPRGGTEIILAVEDNAALRGLVAQQLSQLGYRCLEAATGVEALRVLATQPVDLLFSDVLMPGGMNGVELVNEARERWPGLKLLLTSGFPEEKFVSTGGLGGIRLLSKPYRKDELAGAIRDALDPEA